MKRQRVPPYPGGGRDGEIQATAMLSDNGGRTALACLSLARLGDEVIPFWEDYARRGFAKPATWQLLAMGLHPSPKVLPLLEKLLEGDRGSRARRRGEAYVCAIGMRGQEGRKRLESLLSREPRPPAVESYRVDRLDELLRTPPDLSWPPAEPGSLPTSYTPPAEEAGRPGHPR